MVQLYAVYDFLLVFSRIFMVPPSLSLLGYENLEYEWPWNVLHFPNEIIQLKSGLMV